MHDRLGQIHEDCGHIVFQTDEGYPDEYPVREIAHITQLLRCLFKVLTALLEASNEYAHILAENIKEFTRKQKSSDTTVAAYQKVLQENKRIANEIEVLFYEDSLRMGPFVVRVGDLKKRLNKKLNELNKVLLEQIKRKVDQSKQQIGTEVDEVLKIIRKQNYKNIEEVTETRNFIKVLPDKQLEIQRLIKGVNDKAAVLDENLFRLGEQETISIWEAFARPMEIDQEKGDCIERLDDLSNIFQGDLRTMQGKLNIDIQEIQQEFESIQEYEELS